MSSRQTENAHISQTSTVARNGHPASFFYTPRANVKSTFARRPGWRANVEVLRSNVKLHVGTWSFSFARQPCLR